MSGGRMSAGVIVHAGSRTPGWASNLGIINATTTHTDDSIGIRAADGTALSPENPLWVTLPSTTVPGQLVTLKQESNVTLKLTGATWGLTADATDYMLSVYAINDAGVLKWGTGSVPNHKGVLNADDTATAASVTSVEKIFVNSALGADATAVEVGWVKGLFTFTGGSAELIWAIQSGYGDVHLGPRPSIWQTLNPAQGSWLTVDNATYTGFWRRHGGNLFVQEKIALTGAPTNAVLTTPLPGGLVANTAKLVNATADETVLGMVNILDSGAALYQGAVVYASTTAVKPRFNDASSAVALLQSDITRTAPVTFATGDKVIFDYCLPIVGWS